LNNNNDDEAAINNNGVGGVIDGVSKTTTTKTNKQPLKGLIVVITGASSGIGLGLTQRLNQLGATIIAIGISPPPDIQQLKISHHNQNIETVDADFMDLESVSKAADLIGNNYDHIDVLINNAGIHNGMMGMFESHFTSSKQGYESSFGVNYLSHVLLSEKLMPLLEKSPQKKPKIVQVSSRFHYAVDGSDLRTHSGGTNDPIASRVGGSHGFFFFRTQRQYANSKLAQILHARSLHDRYYTPNNGVTVVSACPNWVGTQIIGPKGTYIQSIFEAIAFPSNGFGISSILHAILDTTTTTTITSTTTESTTSPPARRDLYINTIGLNSHPSYQNNFPDWTYQLFPLRDIAMASIAYGFSLPFQRLITTRDVGYSSQESYDKTLQKELYEWSLLAISEWL